MAVSDVISLHTPLTKKTENMIDANFKKNEKRSSIINTARGKITKDLNLIYKHLKKGKLFCVALDVLPYEPPRREMIL